MSTSVQFMSGADNGPIRLSFVIPAYNVSPWIHQCLDSILGQRGASIEVIVIDDGSTDDTLAQVRDRSRLDARIVVLEQANSGQGAARNRGIEAARGDYLWFVDADDWLFDGVLPRVVDQLARHQPDLMVLSYALAYESGQLQPVPCARPGLDGQPLTVTRRGAHLDTVSPWTAQPWRLLCRRALLNAQAIRFAQGVFFEDHPFALALLIHAQRLVLDAPVVYAYRQRAGSTTQANDAKAFDFLTIRRQCLDLIRSQGLIDEQAGLVMSYALPVEFYRAHVPDALRGDFLIRLRAELTDEERALAHRIARPDQLAFLQEVDSGQPLIIAPPGTGSRLRAALSHPGGIRHLGRRAAQKVRTRARTTAQRIGRAAAVRARALLAPPGVAGQPAGHSAAQVVLGERSILDNYHVEVRVAPQSRPYLIIGNDCQVSGSFIFERGTGQVRVGHSSSIGHGCLFICSQAEGIRIGEHVMLSWNVTVTDTDAHSLDPLIRFNDPVDWRRGIDVGHAGVFKDWSAVRSRPVVIDDMAWIGFGVSILKGVTIGKGAVVGAGSVVRHDVPAYTVVAGNPACFQRYVPRAQWAWHEVIAAAQIDPAMDAVLGDSYLRLDLEQNVSRFHRSEEFTATLALLRELAPQARTLLDVGGGNGTMAFAFAAEGYEVTIVEGDPHEIVGVAAHDRLRERYRKAGHDYLANRVTSIASHIQEAPLPAEDFDLAYVRQATHHFPDPVGCLIAIHGKIRAGGFVLLIREHVVFDPDDKARFLAGHPFHRLYGGEQAYTEDEYLTFARQAGFEVVKVLRFLDSPINYYPHATQAIGQMNEADVPGRPYSFVLRKPA